MQDTGWCGMHHNVVHVHQTVSSDAEVLLWVIFFQKSKHSGYACVLSGSGLSWPVSEYAFFVEEKGEEGVLM
jgi:hypothetical protein